MTSTGALVMAALLGAQAPLPAMAAVPAAPAPAAKKPNVVVILVDDMGFSDIGAYGSEIPTPNIDALAAGGIRFTQFYNSARCSCSRASLISGTYPHQAGLGHLEPIVIPGSMGLHGKLEDRVVTMAEVLHSAGYYTAMAGKWHMGITHGVGPWQRGFDHSLASPVGELYYPNQVQPNAQTAYIDGRKVPASSPELGKDWYSSDLFVDWDTKFFQQAKQEGKPFFLYLPFVAVHFPLMAPADEVAKFRGQYKAGWDALREARFAKQKQLGIVGPGETLPARLPNTYDWNKLSPAERDEFDKKMAVYAADIARMDKAVGTLVQRLKAAGELDNTLILFMADNGGNGESGPDGRDNGKGEPGGPQSNIFAGMNWATLENTPFQYFKHYTEEGGISTPLIAYWPKGIDPKLKGSFVREPGHLIDVMPTVVQISGATYPTTFNGHQIIPMQGRSMAPAFSGQALTRDKPIFFEHEGNRAVRDGRWKLVSQYQKPWQLFDMSTDRSETHDLRLQQPALVKKMALQYDQWARTSDVDTWTNAYDIYLKGKTRQNWGGSERPEHPEAMNSMTPELKATLATPTAMPRGRRAAAGGE